MAISDQIGRLTTLRNNIRSKLINLGILPAASTSATLSECYNVLSSVTGLSAMSYTPTTTAQTIVSGQYINGVQTINAIPSAYIIPSGTITLSSSGTFDVGSYASADVTVAGGDSRVGWLVGNSSQCLSFTSESYLTFSEFSAIRAGAFFMARGCGNISNLSIFENVTTIGSHAFYGMYDWFKMSYAGVTQLFNSIFSNVQHIGSYAFAFCRDYGNSTRISLPNCAYVDDFAFAATKGDQTPIFEFGNSLPTSPYPTYSTAESDIYHVSLPVCTSIGKFAFFGQYAISGLYLPECEYIGSGAFAQALSLGNDGNNIELPECTYIGSYAFAGGAISYSTRIDFYAPKCTYIGSGAFMPTSYAGQGMNRVRNIKRFFFPEYSIMSANSTFYFCDADDFSFPALNVISGNSNFDHCGLSVISFPLLSIISGSNNFSNCGNLQTLNFPNLSIIYGGSNFYQCTGLTQLNLPSLETISGGNNFYNCIVLTQLNLPSLETISGGSNFYNCVRLSSINLPKLATIKVGGYTFASCSAASYANFPSLTTINGPNNFRNCANLQTISVPLLGTISAGGSTFYNCNKLPNINLPNWVYTSSTPSMFYDCHSLSLFSAAKLSIMSGSAMFDRCYHLISVILLSTSVCTLGNTVRSMFTSTPVSTYSTSAGRYASIFVPRSLVASYKTATNWTTISSKIVAYEDYFDSNGNPL